MVRFVMIKDYIDYQYNYIPKRVSISMIHISFCKKRSIIYSDYKFQLFEHILVLRVIQIKNFLSWVTFINAQCISNEQMMQKLLALFSFFIYSIYALNTFPHEM